MSINGFSLFFPIIYLFLAAVRALVAVRGAYSLLWCSGFSLHWLLAGTRVLPGVRASVVAARGPVSAVPGFWSAGSVAVAYGPTCMVACGILPAQGSNLCLWHWQADSLPLSRQENPETAGNPST